MPRDLWWSQGGWRFRMSKVPLLKVSSFCRRCLGSLQQVSSTIRERISIWPMKILPHRSCPFRWLGRAALRCSEDNHPLIRWYVGNQQKHNGLADLISQKALRKSFCRSQFPHKSENLFFKLVMIKDQLTELCRNGLLQNECINTGIDLCKMTV